MTALGDMSTHPNLEQYYDSGTDRSAIDAHLALCGVCRTWLLEIDERLRNLPCIQFVELVTGYLEDSNDDGLRARIDDHLRLCEGCRNYVDELRSTLTTIGEIGRETVPSEPVRVGLVAAFREWWQSDANPRIENA